MQLLDAIILGLVQGLTEFLPVSSSGHLVLGGNLLGVPQHGIYFEVFVHFGTLLSVVTFFFKDIVRITGAFFSSLSAPGRIAAIYAQNYDFRVALLILVGTVPAGLAGLLLNDWIEGIFANPILVCFTLLATGGILLATRFIAASETRQLDLPKALVIGVAQAVAIVPGISRSGSTIATALFFKAPREEAARFSFLLSLPVILGATILKIRELAGETATADEIWILVAGTVVAYVSGLLAIKFLLDVVRRGKLDWFAYYCFLVGLVGLALLLK